MSHMPGRVAPLMSVAFLLAVLAGGCAKAPNLPDHPPVLLIEQWLDAMREAPADPLVLPLDESWTGAGGTLRVAEDGLHWMPEAEDAALFLPVRVDTRRYTALEIAMRVMEGEQCEVAWSSDLRPLPPDTPGHPVVRFPLSPGEEVRDYTFLLYTSPENPWTGTVDQLLVRPAPGVTAEVLITGARFVAVAPRRPDQAEVAGVSMDVFQGTADPLAFTVPPRAWFEAWVGLTYIPGLNVLNGEAVFEAWLTTETGEERRLAAEYLEAGYGLAAPVWRPVRADLSDLAGQRAEVRLEVGRPAGAAESHAWWGAPAVRTAVEDPEAVPVVLISCDTLRADRLSCYGHTRETTPFLDRWAREEAVLFETAIVNETWTLPSHMTMFTGLQPRNHGVTRSADLDEAVVTLPEVLRRHGYLTAGFTGHKWWLAPPRGFGRGMDYYDVSEQSFRHVRETTPRLYDWLEGHAVQRRFLFFHNYDIHYKFAAEGQDYAYDPGVAEYRVFSGDFDREALFSGPDKGHLRGSDLLAGYRIGTFEFTEDEHAFLQAGYDDCIVMIDDTIRGVVEYLKQEGFYDEALIIVTADHGETLNDGDILFDRKNYGHNGVYEELCHVPLIVKFPRGEFAGTRYTPMVQSADLFATIGDVAGLGDLPETDGQSLYQLVRGRGHPIDETYIYHSDRYAVRTNAWKLHHNLDGSDVEYMLFNLLDDPGERHNLYEREVERSEALAARLEEYYRPSGVGWNIRFVTTKPKWDFSYAIASDGLLISAHRVSREGEFARQWVDNNRVIKRNQTLAWPYMFVRTESPEDLLYLALRSEGSCQVVYEGSEEPPGDTHTLTLDPNGQDFAAPASFEPLGGHTVYIWHGPPEEGRQTEMQATEEIREQLEALGYVE